MRILFAALFLLPASICLSQFQGLPIDNSPVNRNEHFMFTYLTPDTIINGSWSRLANYPKRLYGVNCYYIPETGKIFTCGGADSLGIPYKACYFYDPASNSYSPADSLPQGRWSGMLVRVRDSLYLVSSVGSNFLMPDGIIFKYSINQNHWIVKDTMPVPRVHESAVCVYYDSIILLIGGSTNSFQNPVNTIRQYNPSGRTWKTFQPFPINVTTGHAEFSGVDSTIVVEGGIGPPYLNTIYRGHVKHVPLTDSLDITWNLVQTNDTTIFRAGVYRVGGASAGSWMLFGPALRNYSTYNTVYAVHFDYDSVMYWYRMVPNIPDSAGSRPTLAVKMFNDSAKIFMFGGSVGTSPVNSSYSYSFALPVSIGIQPVSGNVPVDYMLNQNYPNPFNPATNIQFHIPASGFVSIKVYDILGREITVLVNENLKQGSYKINFNAANLSSGIYFCTMIAGDFKATKKMLLVK
jgi:type IX secretion system substrate protein/Kelch motif protein